MTSIDHLTAATRRALEDYIDAATNTLDPDIAEAVACDLRSWALEHLEPDSTPDDVATLAMQAGATDDQAPEDADDVTGPWRGRILGIPFNLRIPTPAELTESLWDPEDPRLWRPRAFGGGWDLNFGALAVRLGMIEPDAEAVPFAATPHAAFRVAATLPAALACATVAHYAFRWRTLPPSLPRHWGLDGAADRFTTRGRAAATDIVATVGPALLAAATVGGRRSGPSRAGVLAACTAVATAAAGVTVWRSVPDRRRPLAGPLLMKGILVATGGTLVGLARAGRAAEIRADLGAEGDR